VSQACLALARTRNNPKDLIESIPIPRLDRKSIDAITAQGSAILRLDASDSEARTELLKSLDKQILASYQLSEWEKDLFWQVVWGDASQDVSPAWTEKLWPTHGLIETIREADESGPASIRIRVPGFRRGVQIYDGPIPPDMPGWAMVKGLEFQAEIPWSDAEACHLDPLKVQRFRPLLLSYEARKKMERASAEREKTT
jgi:hypothetical protein